MSYTYLASPYSHQDTAVMEARYVAACEAAAKLMSAGECVFSPIAHSHPVAVHGKLDALSHEFWLKQDFALLRNAKVMKVLRLEGWNKSYGIAKEIEFANSLEIPVEYIDG